MLRPIIVPILLIFYAEVDAIVKPPVPKKNVSSDSRVEYESDRTRKVFGAAGLNLSATGVNTPEAKG